LGLADDEEATRSFKDEIGMGISSDEECVLDGSARNIS